MKYNCAWCDNPVEFPLTLCGYCENQRKEEERKREKQDYYDQEK